MNDKDQSENELESSGKEKNPAESADSVNEEPKGKDLSLEAAARKEQDYVRQRLQKELGREPTREETDKWLSEQTEGH